MTGSVPISPWLPAGAEPGETVAASAVAAGAATWAIAVVAPSAPTVSTAAAAAVLARLSVPARRITESTAGRVTAAAS
jgi:hypothetical protein